MPRANRYFLPGYVWHITQRCHDREFLLNASRDRDVWRRWLYEARRRYGLCVLNYIVTSNHVHLLVYSRNDDRTIANSMQLIAGRTAQSYNRRRGRRGAYWEDRYHAVAVEHGDYLRRCLVYIDLNMVRTGVVKHPSSWRHCGYVEIQSPKPRYRVIDLECLMQLLEFSSVGQFQLAHRHWVDAALADNRSARVPAWTEAVAVGSEHFTCAIKARLGVSGLHRKTELNEAGFVLKEGGMPYTARIKVKNLL